MTLAADEFMRRFLLHVLPAGFHRIRHYGLFANAGRIENLARARELLGPPLPQDQIEHTTETDQPTPLAQPCPCCGGIMIVIETFEPGHAPSHHAPRAPRTAKPPTLNRPLCELHDETRHHSPDMDTHGSMPPPRQNVPVSSVKWCCQAAEFSHQR